jgi:ABC-2 type transport system permease protein
MRAAWLLFVSSLRRMRALLVASALIGVMLCILFGVFNSIVTEYRNWLSLGYTDNDDSILSEDFELYLTERLGVQLIEADEHALETELIEKRVSALVEVPEGFGQAVLTGKEGALQTTFMDDYANRMLLQSYLEGYAVSLDILSAAAGGDEARFEGLLADARERTVEVSTVPLADDVAERARDWGTFRSILGFFLMIGVLLSTGMANILYDDRANGTWQRVRASSVSAPSYVAGVCAAGFVAALLMVVLLFIYLAFSSAASNLPLAQMLPLCLLFGLFAIAFALVCGLLLKSRNAIYFAVVAFSTISSLLGGAFFPLDTAPQVMQQLAHLFPAFWFMDALESLYAGDTTGWLVSAGILALFSLLCFLIASVTFAGRQAPTPRAGD